MLRPTSFSLSSRMRQPSQLLYRLSKGLVCSCLRRRTLETVRWLAHVSWSSSMKVKEPRNYHWMRQSIGFACLSPIVTVDIFQEVNGSIRFHRRRQINDMHRQGFLEFHCF